MASFLTRHLCEVKEGYWQHFANASKMGVGLIGAGLVTLLHGILPFLWVGTGSNWVKAVMARFDARMNDE